MNSPAVAGTEKGRLIAALLNYNLQEDLITRDDGLYRTLLDTVTTIVTELWIDDIDLGPFADRLSRASLHTYSTRSTFIGNNVSQSVHLPSIIDRVVKSPSTIQ